MRSTGLHNDDWVSSSKLSSETRARRYGDTLQDNNTCQVSWQALLLPATDAFAGVISQIINTFEWHWLLAFFSTKAVSVEVLRPLSIEWLVSTVIAHQNIFLTEMRASVAKGNTICTRCFPIVHSSETKWNKMRPSHILQRSKPEGSVNGVERQFALTCNGAD